jgi:Zn finger protein HypA/HybF involved in hydrogenase expression
MKTKHYKTYSDYLDEHGCTIACHHCHEEFGELDENIKITNIEENMLGQDVVSFKCPKCHKDTTSLRRG